MLLDRHRADLLPLIQPCTGEEEQARCHTGAGKERGVTVRVPGQEWIGLPPCRAKKEQGHRHAGTEAVKEKGAAASRWEGARAGR